MSKVGLAAIAIVALMVNSYMIYDEYLGGEGPGWLTGDEDEEETIADLSVTVPEFKMGDLATYDYDIFAQFYYKEYDTGNFTDIELKMNGNLRHWYGNDPVKARDGFWEEHNTLQFQLDTQAGFEIYINSHDSEPLFIEGSMDGVRTEYMDLETERLIRAFTDGEVEIDRLPRVNRALSYTGKVDAYPNPLRELEPTLEKQIFSEGQTIRKGENGTIKQYQYYDLYDATMETYFNWSAEEAVKLRGFETLRVNISSSFFGDFLNFNEKYWISNDVPFPVKRHSRTNQTWEWEEDGGGITWLIVETNNTLQENGYNEGSSAIPWGDCNAKHWYSKHPDGEFRSWDYIPLAGAGYSASSFDMKTEEADSYARQHSQGLQEFLSKYPDAYVSSALYNASHNPIDPKQGSFRWNLTYGHYPTRSEQEYSRATNDWNYSYRVVVIKNVTKDITKPLQTEYIDTIEIEYDWGLRRGYSDLPKSYMPNEPLTLAASEDIMMKHPTVKEYLQDRNGEIEWGDFETIYGLGAANLGGSGPGFMLIEMITGITMPTAEYSWFVQQNTVYESGDTFGVAVDAENGQLIYVVEISGTALLGMFD